MSEGNENGAAEREYIQDPICDTEEMKKIYVRGVPNDKTKEELQKFFEDFTGETAEVQIIQNKDPKKPNFGFITFQTCKCVDELILKRKDLVFNGRTLDVNRAVPKNNTSAGAHEKLKKLFIANLPKFDCTEDDLRKYLEDRHDPKYGTIESVQLIKKKDDQGNKMEENRGYGFVIVSNEDMADKMAIQHATFEFKGRRVELKKSVSTNAERGGGRGQGGFNKGGFQQQGGYGGGDYQGGAGWGADQSWYGYSGWDASYGGGGYGAGYGGGYGGGYGAAPQAAGGRGGGRGGRGGGQRFQPYKR